MTAISHLISLINTGDLEEARNWAQHNGDALWFLRSDPGARAMVAHACNRWKAPMVWPWGDRPPLDPADRRVLVAIRSGRPWRASEDTVARLLAYGAIKLGADGRWVVA